MCTAKDTSAPVGIASCNSKTQGTGEVEPESLSEFASDGCDRHWLDILPNIIKQFSLSPCA